MHIVEQRRLGLRSKLVLPLPELGSERTAPIRRCTEVLARRSQMLPSCMREPPVPYFGFAGLLLFCENGDGFGSSFGLFCFGFFFSLLLRCSPLDIASSP